MLLFQTASFVTIEEWSSYLWYHFSSLIFIWKNYSEKSVTVFIRWFIQVNCGLSKKLFSQLFNIWTQSFFFKLNSFNFKFIFKSKDNCFTEFCWFLSNTNINSPYVYICPLPLTLPPTFLSILTTRPHPCCYGSLVCIQQIPTGCLLYIW